MTSDAIIFLDELLRYLNSKDILYNNKFFIRIRSYIDGFIYNPHVPLNEKRKFLIELQKRKQKILRAIDFLRKNSVIAIERERLMDIIFELYLLGFTDIVDIYYRKLLKLANSNDLLAHLADLLIDTGHVRYAVEILRRLLRAKYNLKVVLLNLAMLVYMLGRPNKAKKFLEYYEKVTGKASTLKMALNIAIGLYDSKNLIRIGRSNEQH